VTFSLGEVVRETAKSFHGINRGVFNLQQEAMCRACLGADSTSARQKRSTSAVFRPDFPSVLSGEIPAGSSMLVGQVVGRRNGEDAVVAAGQQHPFEQAAALVVKEILVPMILDKLGNDHHDAAVGMLL
jgi:hypothetical protein